MRSLSFHRLAPWLGALTAMSIACLGDTGAAAQGLLRVGSAVDIRNLVTGRVEADKRRLGVGYPVHRNELIEATRGSRGEFSLEDETKLVVDSGARLFIDEFVYDPGGAKGAVVLNLTRGAMRFVTGKSAKDAYEIKTPVASIGVRGTIFDAFVSAAGELAVLLIEGAVEVCTEQFPRRVCRIHDRIGEFLYVRRGSPMRHVPKFDGTFLRQQPIQIAFPFVGDPPSFRGAPTWRYDDLQSTLPPPPPLGPPGGRDPGDDEPRDPLPPRTDVPSDSVHPVDPEPGRDAGSVIPPIIVVPGGGHRFCERYPRHPRCTVHHPEDCKRYPSASGCRKDDRTADFCKRYPNLPRCKQNADGGDRCKRSPSAPGCKSRHTDEETGKRRGKKEPPIASDGTHRRSSDKADKGRRSEGARDRLERHRERVERSRRHRTGGSGGESGGKVIKKRAPKYEEATGRRGHRSKSASGSSSRSLRRVTPPKSLERARVRSTMRRTGGLTGLRSVRSSTGSGMLRAKPRVSMPRGRSFSRLR